MSKRMKLQRSVRKALSRLTKKSFTLSKFERELPDHFDAPECLKFMVLTGRIRHNRAKNNYEVLEIT